MVDSAEILPCATCRIAVVPAPEGDGASERACPRCATIHRLFRGKLLTASSSRIVVERASSKRAGVYDYLNQFSVFFDGSAKRFSYKTPDPQVGVVFLKGTAVTVVCLPRDAEEDAHFVHSHLTNEFVTMPSPAGPTPGAADVRELTARAEGIGAPGHGLVALPGLLSRPSKSDALHCAKCRQPIFDPQTDGISEVVCHRCELPYLIVTGTIWSANSSRIVHQRQGTRQVGVYSWFHQFTIGYGSQYKAFSYSTPTPVGGITFPKGVRASAVCTRRGQDVEDIVYVHCHDIHQRISISQPGAAALRRANWFAVALAALVLIFVAMLSTWTVGLVVSVVVGLALRVVLARALMPKAQLDASQVRAASRQQDLLVSKQTLSARREEFVQEKLGWSDRVARLAALEAKMRSVGDELYATRIDRLRAAIGALQPLMENQSALIASHDRAIAMIEIELDGANVPEVAAHSDSEALARQLAELQRVEAVNADMRLKLESEDEVERLLHAG